LDRREFPVLPVPMVLQDHKDRLAPKGKLVSRVKLARLAALLARRVTREIPVRLEPLDQWALLARLVLMVCTVSTASLVPTARMVKMASRVSQVRPV
jgi:hypothetical protein